MQRNWNYLLDVQESGFGGLATEIYQKEKKIFLSVILFLVSVCLMFMWRFILCSFNTVCYQIRFYQEHWPLQLYTWIYVTSSCFNELTILLEQHWEWQKHFVKKLSTIWIVLKDNMHQLHDWTIYVYVYCRKLCFIIGNRHW